MKIRVLALSALLLMAGFVLNHHATVDAAATVTPEIIARVKARCVENQAGLNRLQQTDAFLRNDRGNLYRTISDKLMVPLNRRLASNQLDGASLLTITSDYNKEYARFSDAYVKYDIALSKVRGIDCSREPVAFYNALLDAREKRAELSRSNLAIKELVRKYGVAFTEFRAQYEANKL